MIVALASQHTTSLNTFSIGYKDASFFDETEYAESVANKFNTNHTVFSLTQDDLLANIGEIINDIDEPFADSSAIPIHILSHETRKHVTIALSGDGADEIFLGYNKHSAWLRSEEENFSSFILSGLFPLAKILPKSRSGKISNKLRQIVKFGEGKKMNRADRYWFWASISRQKEINDLLKNSNEGNASTNQINYWLKNMTDYRDFNDFLRTDTSLVLPNDMLQKVDLMSMANSLEVRVPFLDHKIVDFAFKIPPDHKIDGGMRKKILQDPFRYILPEKLYKRPKKGFEVPLLDWMRKGLKSDIDKYVFDQAFIESQNLFNSKAIAILRKKLFSMNPEDAHAKVWALYVFQKWYMKYFKI